jgi:hypothetical protein
MASRRVSGANAFRSLPRWVNFSRVILTDDLIAYHSQPNLSLLVGLEGFGLTLGEGKSLTLEQKTTAETPENSLNLPFYLPSPVNTGLEHQV